MRKQAKIIEESDQNQINELPKSFRDKLNEAEKNLNKHGYSSLCALFAVPEGIIKDRFKFLLKDNIVYKKFLKSLPSDDEKY